MVALRGLPASTSTPSLPPVPLLGNEDLHPLRDRPSAGPGPSSYAARTKRATIGGPGPISGATGGHAGASNAAAVPAQKRQHGPRISWSGAFAAEQDVPDGPVGRPAQGRTSTDLHRAHPAATGDRPIALRASHPPAPPPLEAVRSEASIGAVGFALTDQHRLSLPGVHGVNHFPPRPRLQPQQRGQGGLRGEGSMASLTSVTSYHRLSEFGSELISKREEEEEERQREADKQRLNLPDLVAATRRSLPSLKSTLLKDGRSAFIERRGADDDDGSDGEEERGERSTLRTHSKTGPGGLPHQSDAKAYLAREDDVMSIASSMGMVKQVQRAAGPQILLNTNITKRPKASSTASVQQASPLGVQLSVLVRFADSIQTELSTADMVQKYIVPQTTKLSCRYIDLVNEKLTDTPSYYLIHCWKMGFRDLVDTLRQHFALTRQPEEEVVIWADFFCVNQHRPMGPSELSVVADIMRSTEKALLVLDRRGVCFQRTWVLYELMQICQIDNRDTVNQSGISGERLLVLPASWAWDDLYHSYITIDIAKSGCGNEKQRLALLNELQKADPTKVTADIKNLLCTSAKFSLNRAGKQSGVNPRRYIDAATTYAMMLYLQARYIEAEDVMKSIKAVIERANHKDVLPQDGAAYLLHLALIEREKGVLSDAQKVLMDFSLQFKGLPHPIFQAGLSVLVDIHCALKAYTKAEMLCRKCLDQREKQAGDVSVPVLHSLLQLANISAAQRLYDEAAEHASSAMKLANQLDGPESLDAAACYHMLALCYFHNNRLDDAGPLLDRALVIRQTRLGTDHPVTLESKSVQSMWLVKQGQLAEAEVLMNGILRSRIRSYGPDHHDTLESMGSIADLLRSMNKVEEAQYSERRMLDIGRSLLRLVRMNRFRSLQYICTYLKSREHLLDKAAMFIAKTYIVCKERLGSDAEMTLETKQQLTEIIANANYLGLQALHNAELYQKPEDFAVAEDYLKQAWSLSKLIKPEEDHAEMVQSLADALTAQEKGGEARSVMRAAGLVKKGPKQQMPSSYLRWFNKRVSQYLEKQGGDGDDEQ